MKFPRLVALLHQSKIGKCIVALFRDGFSAYRIFPNHPFSRRSSMRYSACKRRQVDVMLAATLRMQGDALIKSIVLPRRGQWNVQIECAGASGYERDIDACRLADFQHAGFVFVVDARGMLGIKRSVFLSGLNFPITLA
jgi:hypothetical protein